MVPAEGNRQRGEARPWRVSNSRGSRSPPSKDVPAVNQIRWSPDAAADLEGIVEYIRRDNLTEAQRVGQEIYNRLGMLGAFPYSGRRGRVEGTSELPLPPLPFIVVYRVLEREDAVEIVNVIHGAQRWPPVG